MGDGYENDPPMANNTAQVVRERNEQFDMQHGPSGYERVGFRIGERVFWTGLACSYQSGPGTWAEDEALAREIVRRWNTGSAP